MFASSHPFGLFDYFGVPCRVAEDLPAPEGLGVLRADGSGRRLWWARTGTRRTSYRSGTFRVGDAAVAGRLALDPPARRLPGNWSPAVPVTDLAGAALTAVWTDRQGNAFVPFDPAEVMRTLWSEAYTELGGRAAAVRALRGTAVRGYYAVRPLLPRPVQLGLRRRLARRQQPPGFPAWPLETGLHGMYDVLLGLATAVAGGPVPYLAPWPDDRSWAMVLTHDVETAQGRDEMELLRADERRLGYRSSWNFVPERYRVDEATLQRVREEGCEVGVHGLRHDGRDLASARMLARRGPAMRRHAEQWGAVGFRSPATQRSWRLMPRLGFDYDSSYTDTDPYEPTPGGCCSYLPFLHDSLVELPITLPQDHTLFEILGHTDGRAWVEKARALRERGGMVLVLAHPDYARDPHLVAGWRALLEEFAGDAAMWQPLPRELARWWRDRAATRLVRDGDAWRLEGPAAGRGRVAWTAGADAAASR